MALFSYLHYRSGPNAHNEVVVCVPIRR